MYMRHFPRHLDEAQSASLSLPRNPKPLVKEKLAEKKAREIEKSPDVTQQIASSPTK